VRALASLRMEILETRLEGPVLLRPRRFADDRGFFAETFRADVFAEHGITEDFVQDNHSRSRRGVVRGMHFQNAVEGAGKLVRCARGAICDVVVDLRAGSPTYGEWEGFELTDETLDILFCPHGFAHGFVVLSDVADVTYKQSAYYRADVEAEFSYADPDVAIAWPEDVELQPSARDARAPLLRDIAAGLPFRYEAAGRR
jgi:dTDP-4-dehydrorhamnose 3,5-epimerase